MATERDVREGDLCFCRGSWSSNLGFQNWQTVDQSRTEKSSSGRRWEIWCGCNWKKAEVIWPLFLKFQRFEKSR